MWLIIIIYPSDREVLPNWWQIVKMEKLKEDIGNVEQFKEINANDNIILILSRMGKKEERRKEGEGREKGKLEYKITRYR